MAFEELRERASDQLSAVVAQIKESTVYNNLKEKFEILPVSQQNAILGFIGVAFAILLIMIPYGSLSTSWESEGTFTEYRDTMRELLRTSTIKSTESNRVGFSPSSATMRLKSKLLLDVQEQQIASIQPIPLSKRPSAVPSQIDVEAVQIKVNELNLNQVVRVGYSIQKLSDNSQLYNIDIQANAKNDHLFDVTYELIGFNLKKSNDDEDPSKKSNSRSNNRRGR